MIVAHARWITLHHREPNESTREDQHSPAVFENNLAPIDLHANDFSTRDNIVLGLLRK